MQKTFLIDKYLHVKIRFKANEICIGIYEKMKKKPKQLKYVYTVIIHEIVILSAILKLEVFNKILGDLVDYESIYIIIYKLACVA